MLHIDIPNGPTFALRHLVLDYNGTLAVDGTLLPGVAEGISEIARQLEVHILTADTHGTVATQARDLPCRIHIIDTSPQDLAKLAYVRSLDPATVVCIGNGRNDRLMLKEAALGIALIQQEGASVETLLNADVVCTSILDAFDLFRKDGRLKATLRN